MRRPNFSINASGIPLLSAQEIEHYAESLIGEFSPLLLQTAASFDIQHFIREELSCHLATLPLCADGSISAQTFFRETLLDYTDERGSHRLRVPANTIILNRALITEPGEARFSLAHEAGHFLLHAEFYRAMPPAITAQEEKMLEDQADCFAYALLMPAPTLRAYWNSAQVYCERIYCGDPVMTNKYAAASFAIHCKVSRSCAARRLRQLGLVRVEGPKAEPQPESREGGAVG